jgi:hypothetical protein
MWLILAIFRFRYVSLGFFRFARFRFACDFQCFVSKRNKRKKICLIFASFRFNRKQTAHPILKPDFKKTSQNKYYKILTCKLTCPNIGLLVGGNMLWSEPAQCSFNTQFMMASLLLWKKWPENVVFTHLLYRKVFGIRTFWHDPNTNPSKILWNVLYNVFSPPFLASHKKIWYCHFILLPFNKFSKPGGFS